MKLCIVLILIILLDLGGATSLHRDGDKTSWLANASEYLREFAHGAKDMWRAYKDMREANVYDADKYFHARGNYDAANRGPGGRDAAKVISNSREFIQEMLGHGHTDSMKDQEANVWGRSGGNPNKYRPHGLDDRY